MIFELAPFSLHQSDLTFGAHSMISWCEIESDPAIFEAIQVQVPSSSRLTPDSSKESFAKITFGKFSLVTGTPSFSHWMSGSGTPSTVQVNLNIQLSNQIALFLTHELWQILTSSGSPSTIVWVWSSVTIAAGVWTSRVTVIISSPAEFTAWQM